MTQRRIWCSTQCSPLLNVLILEMETKMMDWSLQMPKLHFKDYWYFVSYHQFSSSLGTKLFLPSCYFRYRENGISALPAKYLSWYLLVEILFPRNKTASWVSPELNTYNPQENPHMQRILSELSRMFII